MRVTWNGKNEGKRIVALGEFDGVHLGHLQLLEKGIEWGREQGILLRACTFDRHPMEVIRPDAAPGLLTTLPEKIRRMERIGVEELHVIRFTRKKANQEPEDFLRELREECLLWGVIAGWNYTFGRQGRGNVELLQQDGEKYGYQVMIVPPVKTQSGITISSTEIRNALEAGKAGLATELMGDPYSLLGIVQGKKAETDQLLVAVNAGKRKKILPAFGVYACLAQRDRQMIPAVAHIGQELTTASGETTVEMIPLVPSIFPAGERLRLQLVDRLREEKAFSSPEELLKQQIQDCAEARFLFGMA